MADLGHTRVNDLIVVNDTKINGNIEIDGKIVALKHIPELKSPKFLISTSATPEDMLHWTSVSDISVGSATYASRALKISDQDGSMTAESLCVKPQFNNEINFGGSNASRTIYFGYRKTDNKDTPTSFIFGGGDGTATLTSNGFKKKGSSDSYVLLGGGGHKAVSTLVQTSGNQTIADTKTFSGMIDSTFTSNSWINSVTNSVLNLRHSGYGGIFSAPVKSGRIALSTYPASGDLVYLGYAEKDRVENSFTRSMTWDASDGALTTAKFVGNLTGTATNAGTATYATQIGDSSASYTKADLDKTFSTFITKTDKNIQVLLGSGSKVTAGNNGQVLTQTSTGPAWSSPITKITTEATTVEPASTGSALTSSGSINGQTLTLNINVPRGYRGASLSSVKLKTTGAQGGNDVYNIIDSDNKTLTGTFNVYHPKDGPNTITTSTTTSTNVRGKYLRVVSNADKVEFVDLPAANGNTAGIVKLANSGTATTVSRSDHTHSTYVPTSRTVNGQDLSSNIELYSGTLTTGQILIADGTAGKYKTSGYTIATSVPSNAKFTDTTYNLTDVSAANGKPKGVKSEGYYLSNTTYINYDSTEEAIIFNFV